MTTIRSWSRLGGRIAFVLQQLVNLQLHLPQLLHSICEFALVPDPIDPIDLSILLHRLSERTLESSQLLGIELNHLSCSRRTNDFLLPASGPQHAAKVSDHVLHVFILFGC